MPETTPAVIAEAAPATNLISTDAEYRKTGVRPEPPKAADPAPAKESSDLETGTTVAETGTDDESSETAAASEAAHQEPQKPKRNAETRIRELVAERNKLSAQLEEARRAKETPKPAESSPAPAKEATKPQNEAPKKPEAKDFDKYDDYEAAKDKYFEDLADYRATQAVKKAEFDRQRRAEFESAQKELAEARKRYPDFDEKAIPFTKEIFTDPNVNDLIRARLNKSTVLADLMYVMAGDEAKATAFLESAKRDPLAALDELVLTERLVKEELAKSGKEAPEKTTPKPPPPPPEVSGKGTTPGDELEEARKAADGSPERFARYKALADARDIKARGSRR